MSGFCSRVRSCPETELVLDVANFQLMVILLASLSALQISRMFAVVLGGCAKGKVAQPGNPLFSFGRQPLTLLRLAARLRYLVLTASAN